jgi:penicillin amidase
MLTWTRRIAFGLLALLLMAALAAWLALRGSLPTLDGEATLPDLSGTATVQRDANGVVTIDAASETDALRALGYVHAQERYFEMDLLRRTAAGELAALFGSIAIDTDKAHRIHRMRHRVQRDLAGISGDKRPQLDAYVAGVNAGLGALRTRPWPYLLLRQAPAPWTAADTPLAGYAMYFDLQDGNNARELALWRMRPHLPPALYALLTRDGTRWDAPLVGEARGDAVLPGADAVDLRRLPAPPAPAPGRADTKGTPGSNNFAVSGALTADGRAIVADDMHLGLRAPNIWFRARLRYPDPAAPGGRVDVQGFTLPGLPAVIVGSNGHVAWGFTNSYGDYLDWKRETPCNDGADADAPAAGCARVQRVQERIDVAGADAVAFEVEQTAWGPVLHREADGDVLSLRWTAHQPGSVNLGVSALATASDLDHALAIADRAAVPTQNLVIGDAGGRIAWRLLGPLASRRPGCDSSHLVEGVASPHAAAAASCAPWGIDNRGGRVSLQSPTAQRLWTANNRTLDGDALHSVGDGGYAFGARAHQIRERLHARQRFTERDLLDLQLDDRAVQLTPWWTLLRQQAARTRTPAMTALSGASARWEGRASIDSVSYRIVRAWRLAVQARIADGLTAPAQAALGKDFVMPDLPQIEGAVWPLVTQRPTHLLSRRYTSWEALFEDAAKEVRDELAQFGPLEQRTWGERNTAAICHPLAGAIPLLGKRLLCMPPDQLPGDGAMPRVQGPAFGASQRMVVSPGHETDGFIHMPGGQSGHFLSPYWGAGHDDWVRGRPTPFLPGRTAHTLTLTGE